MYAKTFKSFDEYVVHFMTKCQWDEYNREQSGTGDSYKLKLQEKTQVICEIEDARDVISHLHNYRQFPVWTILEFLTEIFGDNPPRMYKYPEFKKIIEWAYKLRPDKTVEYMYGSRWSEFGQLYNVINILSQRKDSKRAVMAIFTPYDTDPTRKDVPCTNFYHFNIRDNKLNMTVFFRSHDLNSGVKYDVLLSSFMCQIIAMAVSANRHEKIEPGNLCLWDNSLHMYPIRDENKLHALRTEIKNDRHIENKYYFDIMYDYKNMQDLFEDLLLLKEVEELAFYQKFDNLVEMILKIKNPALQDFAKALYNRHRKIIQKLDYSTNCLWWN